MHDAEACVERADVTHQPFRMLGQTSYMVYTQLKSASHLCACHSLDLAAQKVAPSECSFTSFRRLPANRWCLASRTPDDSDSLAQVRWTQRVLRHTYGNILLRAHSEHRYVAHVHSTA